MTITHPREPIRILCITATFVPRGTSETFCGAKMVAALRKVGADVQVICDREYLNEPGALLDNSSYWSSLESVTHPLDATKSRSGLKALYYAVRYRAYKFHPRWISALVRHARALHRQKPFDLVYSRSPVTRSHVAGYWAKRALDVPWVANINDPWELHLFPDSPPRKVSSLYAAISNYWLGKTLRSADLVTYPSARLGHFTERLAGVKHNRAVIPHVGQAVEPASDEDGVFRLVHAGKLTAGSRTERSSSGLLRGLSRFLEARPEARANTQLVLAGPEDENSRQLLIELGLEEIVRPVGRKSYEESLRLVSSATICVLVEARMKEGIYLPSKFADYIVARKPVLALSPSNGTIADAADGGVIRLDCDDEEGIAAAIEKYYVYFLNGSLADHVPSEETVRSYEGHVLAEKFLKEAQRLLRAETG